MRLLTCNANPKLAQDIADLLNVKITDMNIQNFSDKEIFVEVKENVRGEDVFLIQPTSYPTNDNIMELLITVDALRRASARRITAVIPYYGYARQDRKTAPRTPITAKLVADLISTAGADRVLTMDLHAGQIQGFFNIPTDNLFAAPVFARDIKERYGDMGDDLLVVSPDVGGVVRARNLAARLGTTIAIIDKRRPEAGQSEVMNIIGEVKGKSCILIDDIVDSGGTLCNAAHALLQGGAKEVSAYISHGVLSGKATERIKNSDLKELVITDSIQPTENVLATPNIRILSVAPLLAEAISRVSNEESVSTLFIT
ncbi:MAG: ribose-phosphate pyrophosphokinase [Pseudomonadota bacterium]